MNSDHIVDLRNKRIWVTGHKGMLGSALVRRMLECDSKLLLATKEELDLRDAAAVDSWVKSHKPELVFHVGAKVGGIHANATLRGDFLFSNLMIQTNVIHAAKQYGVEKLIFVASNCTYPVNAPQPLKEESLLTGPLESNIRSYAIAKIAGIEMCRAYKEQYGCNFISVIPPNLYGPGDNYHPEHAHVVAGILRRAIESKESGSKAMVVWGDGTPKRELLFVDDLADALVFLMGRCTQDDLYNVGSGYDLTIAELAQKVMDAVGFEGRIEFDKNKPNGTMSKLLDSTRIRELGWRPSINEAVGLKRAYLDFLRLRESADQTHRL